MVMKKNAMRKNLRQSILKSLGRYIAIVAIIALGASMFVGLLMTKSDMVATGQKFMDEQNMFDLRLMNSYGWTREYVDAVSQLEGVVDAEGVAYLDVIANVGEDSEDSVYRFYTMPETVNLISLRGGRMPQSPNEILAEGYHADNSILGTTVTIAESNEEDTLESMVYKTYTIVGYVATPLYMDMNHGTTSVGNGSLASYFYVPDGGLDLEYYAEINITIPGDYDIYSEQYNDALEAAADALEPLLEPLAQQRLEQVKLDAEIAYWDGMEEYLQGLQEFQMGKKEAEEELEDAYRQLTEAEEEIAENEQLLADGEAQIAEAKLMLKESEKTLKEAEQTLSDSKAAAYKQISSSTTELLTEFGALTSDLTALQSEMTALDAEEAALNAAIMQLEAELSLIDSQIAQPRTMISILGISIEASRNSMEQAAQNGADEEKLAEMEQEILDLQNRQSAYQNQLAEKEAERAAKEAELAPYYAQQKELESRRSELESRSAALEASVTSITESLLMLTASQAVMDAEFAAAEAQIESGAAQIEAGYLELELREQEIADGRLALEDGRAELADGWKEYEKGRAEAEAEIADAEAELEDARIQLADARQTIDEMLTNDVFILDRTSNVGYNSLDSASDIVQGVSRVFPAFFLLVAALVCITTMTRMIDEERTQIGTLKALGYSNTAIISKYLLYAGSGAVVGCGLGVIVGSVIFPAILWQAYKIMLFITDGIVLQFNWWLCGIVVSAYTIVMLLVTWYCCRRTLREEPAELIRPKAPEAGKKILMEYLPFWHKISFLNKVTIRNIFRYRQRLAMMMVGIGGCTALLVTGFGLRDSIVNVVDYQFEEVTTYDMTVYFADGLTDEEKQDFLKEVEADVDNIMFYYQSSIELDFDSKTKEIYMIAAEDQVKDFVDLHSGDTELDMPGVNEVLLTVGAAEAMGIDVGDQVVLRNSDLQILELTVSGIYDNHVYNYAIVSPNTIEAQWGEPAEEQMAFITVPEGTSAHEISAGITGLDGVMNVAVSEDLADMVGNMMEALDLVVIVIVFCAGLLAAIVLYNLTNININERIREISTIKVLGFNAMETALYVFKENLSLSAFGSVVGLGFGYLLLLFVMSQIKIDMVWFKALVMPISYVWSIVLTMLAAVIVDFIFYFKLEKINMAEALKSVE